MDPVEQYLDVISRQLTVDPNTKEDIIAEIRGHLREAEKHMTEQGMAEPAAQAVAQFGAIDSMITGLNAIHPIYWDRRHFLRGIGIGILGVWGAWVLCIFPFLAWYAVQNESVIPRELSLGRILFDATPLAFGAFGVLHTYPLPFLMPFLTLYSIVPFAWGRRAGNGWQAGMAYGLGAVVGIPWLLPGIIATLIAQQVSPVPGSVFSALVVWLCVPWALFVGWVGARSRQWHLAFTKHGADRIPYLLDVQAGLRLVRRRAVVIGLIAVTLLVPVLFVNAWWVQRVRAQVPPPVVSQFAMVQQQVPFKIRQPTQLPPGMHLVRVDVGTEMTILAPRGVPFAMLTYRRDLIPLDSTGEDGQEISITEYREGAGDSPAKNVHADNGGIVAEGIYEPVWWLGTVEHAVTEISVQEVSQGITINTTAWNINDPDQMLQIAQTLQ